MGPGRSIGTTTYYCNPCLEICPSEGDGGKRRTVSTGWEVHRGPKRNGGPGWAFDGLPELAHAAPLCRSAKIADRCLKAVAVLLIIAAIFTLEMTWEPNGEVDFGLAVVQNTVGCWCLFTDDGGFGCPGRWSSALALHFQLQSFTQHQPRPSVSRMKPECGAFLLQL